MSYVIFSHTKLRETAYQQKLLSQKQWFEEHDFPVFIPQKPNKSNFEQDALVIKKSLPALQKQWKNIEKDYFKVVGDFKHVRLLPQYISHITLYGPEGQFQAPNILFLRLRTVKDKKLALETIGHELIHVCLGDFFEKKKLKYEEVEWLVDNLMLQTRLKQLFPEYKQQTVGKRRKDILAEVLHT